MSLAAKKFDIEKKAAAVLSRKQLREHRDIVYRDYVDAYNDTKARLLRIDPQGTKKKDSEWARLKQQEIAHHNAIFLHELYFENVGAPPGRPERKSRDYIEEHFGSLDNMKNQFFAAARSSVEGWALWGFSVLEQKSIVACVDGDDIHLPYGTLPLIVLDVCEHAYGADYGKDREEYIARFWKHLDWAVVERRALESIWAKPETVWVNP